MKVYTSKYELTQPSDKKVWCPQHSDIAYGVKFTYKCNELPANAKLYDGDNEISANANKIDGYTIFESATTNPEVKELKVKYDAALSVNYLQTGNNAIFNKQNVFRNPYPFGIVLSSCVFSGLPTGNRIYCFDADEKLVGKTITDVADKALFSGMWMNGKWGGVTGSKIIPPFGQMTLHTGSTPDFKLVVFPDAGYAPEFKLVSEATDTTVFDIDKQGNTKTVTEDEWATLSANADAGTLYFVIPNAD